MLSKKTIDALWMRASKEWVEDDLRTVQFRFARLIEAAALENAAKKASCAKIVRHVSDMQRNPSVFWAGYDELAFTLRAHAKKCRKQL